MGLGWGSLLMRPSMILLLRSLIRLLMLSLSLRPRMRYSSKRVTYSSQSCLVILPSWKLSKLSFKKEIMAGKFSSAEKYCLVFCPFCSISAVALSLALVSPACPQPKSSMLMMTFMRNRVSEGSRLEAYSAFLTPSATSPIFIRMKDWMQKDLTRPGSSSKVLPMCCMLLGQSPMAQQRMERLLWYMTSVGAFSTASRCFPMDSLYLASSKYFTPMLDRFSSPYSLSLFFTLSNSYRMWSQVSKSFCRRCGSIRLSHSRPPELSIEGRYLAAHFSSSSIFFVILSRLPLPSSKKSQFNFRAYSLSLRERAMLPSSFRHSEYRQRALAKVGQIRRAASSMGLALLNLPSRIQSAADLTVRYAC